MFSRSLTIAALLLSLSVVSASSIQQKTATVFMPAAATETLVSPAADPDPRNETTIGVSPKNDQIIVGASRVIAGGGGPGNRGITRVGYYYSSDGGRTWGSALVGLDTPQKTWGRMTDPIVVVDTDGVFYLSVLLLDNENFDSGVYLYRSTDNGRTFTDPAPIALDIGSGSLPKLADKPYVTIDTSNSSPFKNSIYAVWVSIEPGRTVILSSRRRPGESAFSEPKSISHSGDMRGPSVTTGPNGEMYAAWEGIGNPKTILFNASTDGGETFLPPLVAPSIDYNVHNFTGSLSEPGAAIAVFPIRRMNSFPVIDVDRGNGPDRGSVYITWAEAFGNFGADVFIKKITLKENDDPIIGPTVRVNDDAGGADQFFPWLSVDSLTGAVNVAFYDRREDPTGFFMHAYMARSTNGGASFDRNVKMSSELSDPRVQADVVNIRGTGIGIGDYIGIAAARGKAHVLWTDSRARKQEIFYAQVVFERLGPSNDECQSSAVIGTLPFEIDADTSAATPAANDPQSCSGSDSSTIWYSVTPVVDTVLGAEAIGNYDTVLSVYTGSCGALTRVACNDNAPDATGGGAGSLLTFQARAGTTYFVVVGGKNSGGQVRARIGHPAISKVEFKKGPDRSKSLKITGAGFALNNSRVIVRFDGGDNEMTSVFYTGAQHADGTVAEIFATRSKLKKLVKSGRTVLVQVESPAGSGRFSNVYSFTR
ncbi:MAG TPA: sialidase family protein [Blastocatellia bacterium]